MSSVTCKTCSRLPLQMHADPLLLSEDPQIVLQQDQICGSEHKVAMLTGNVANDVVESLFHSVLILVDDTTLIQV